MSISLALNYHNAQGNKLRVAFQLTVDAFLWFDVNGAGRINRFNWLSSSLAVTMVSPDSLLTRYGRTEMASRLATSTQLHSPTKKMSILKEKNASTRQSQ